MTLIHSLQVHTTRDSRELDPRARLAVSNGAGQTSVKLVGAPVALCVALGALPARAQESAPAAGAEVPQTGGGPGVGAAVKGQDSAVLSNPEPVTLQRGSAGLWRRANLKTLIANAPKAAGLPPANIRLAPLPGRAGIGASRDAVGVALPGHDVAGIAARAGTRLTGIGTPAGNVGKVTHQTAVPAK